MKIRIKGNSIRIRLSRTEVERLGTEGYLEERTEFGSGAFVYALQSNEGADTLSARFADGRITMYVPTQITSAWAGNDVVGYDHNMDIGNGKHLFLLLEKDFKCIDGQVLEDQSDNYENPLHACE